MLFGIPEADLVTVREGTDANLRTEAGKPMEIAADTTFGSEMYADYIDWRIDHPSDDLMTDLLQAEFEDENGVTRTLTRDEALMYTTVVTGRGQRDHHPAHRLGGQGARPTTPTSGASWWRIGRSSRTRSRSCCGTSPPGRRSAATCRRTSSSTTRPIPAGSAMLFLVGSADRDERKYDDPDRFDIHRNIGQHLTFGYGIHFCLGAALARLEGRIALDEVLSRFPEWEVDMDRAHLAPTSTVRGWETLPVTVP